MSKYRQAARVDDNQKKIVKDLRAIHGVTVVVGHDDILVGYNGLTLWYEIKDPKKTLKSDGTYKAGAIKESQHDLYANWEGHYEIVHSIEQILEDMGIA